MRDVGSFGVFGLNVRSELPLPELPEGDRAASSIEVRLGEVREPAEAVAVDTDGTIILAIPDVGRFEISGGNRIVIEPAPKAAERDLRVFLLGSAFGALLHQRGLLPLHSNSVDVDGRAVAFAGKSGAGKSTLAHWCERRGLPVLADDVSAIAVGEPPMVFPGVPRFRLSPAALEAAGIDRASVSPSFGNQGKFEVPASRSAPAALPLGVCYVLARVAADEAPGIFPLSRLEAAEAIMANTYRGRFTRLLGVTERHFRQCLQLADTVPVFRAARLWGDEQFDEQASILLEHARRTVRQAARLAQPAPTS